MSKLTVPFRQLLGLDASWEVSGGSLCLEGNRVTIKIAPKKLKVFKRRVKVLTGRSRGISMTLRLTDLNRYLRGWIGYFGLARQLDDIADLDGCRVFFLATRAAAFGCATGNSGGAPSRRSATWCAWASIWTWRTNTR